MRRILFGGFALVLFLTTATVANAQVGGKSPMAPRAISKGDDEANPEDARGAPAMQYFFALSSAVLILATVCKPSRKTQ